MSFLLVSPDRTGVGLKSDSFLTAPVKYIPSWFPGAGFKKTARHFKEFLSPLINKPFDDMMGRVVSFLG